MAQTFTSPVFDTKISEDTLEKCPPQVIKRASILYNNSLGFEPPTEEAPHFVIASLPDSDLSHHHLTSLRRLSGSKTVNLIDFLGREFLTIHWTEYSLIDKVLDTLLKIDIRFSLHGKLKASFNPNDGDREYSREIAEKKFIYFIERLERCGNRLTKENSFIRNCYHAVSHQWNWISPEGKDFCKKLRKANAKSEVCTNDKWNFFKWNIFQNCDLSTLQDQPEQQQQQPIECFPRRIAGETEECLVCLDKTADVIVLPCMHMVVCQDCSKKMRGTINAEKCILCRQTIDEILD